MDSELKQNLADWYAVRETIERLPSGLKVKIRKVTSQELAVNGQIPIALTAKWDSMIQADLDRPDDKPETTEETLNNGKLRQEMYETVCKSVLIWPKLGEFTDLENGVITIDALSLEDKAAIFNLANRGVRLLDKFRGEEKEPSNSSHSSSNVPSKAE